MEKVLYESPDYDGEDKGFQIVEFEGSLYVESRIESGNYVSIVKISDVVEGLKKAGIL